MVRVSVLSPLHTIGVDLIPHTQGIHVRSLVDQELDERQMVHVGRTNGIIAPFDVAVVRGEIERPPAAVISKVRICAVIKKVFPDLVVLVLSSRKQGSPAVVGGLVYAGSGFDEDFHRLEIALARGKDQGGHAAAILQLIAIAEEGCRIRHVVAGGNGTFGGRGRAASGAGCSIAAHIVAVRKPGCCRWRKICPARPDFRGGGRAEVRSTRQ